MSDCFQCDWCHRDPYPGPRYCPTRAVVPHTGKTGTTVTLFSVILPWGWWMMDSCTDLGSEVSRPLPASPPVPRSWCLYIHACLFSTKRHPKVKINSNLKINEAGMQLASFKNLYTRLFTDTLPRFLCGPSSKLHLLVIASKVRLDQRWQTNGWRRSADDSALSHHGNQRLDSLAGTDGFHWETGFASQAVHFAENRNRRNAPLDDD